jgi:hypothetical protein
MGSSLSNNDMPRYSVVRSVNFLVARHALIDLHGAATSTSGCTTSCTSYMGLMGAETFSGVPRISSCCTLLPLTPLERNYFSKKTPLQVISFGFPRIPHKAIFVQLWSELV